MAELPACSISTFSKTKVENVVPLPQHPREEAGAAGRVHRLALFDHRRQQAEGRVAEDVDGESDPWNEPKGATRWLRVPVRHRAQALITPPMPLATARAKRASSLLGRRGASWPARQVLTRL